MSENPLLLDPRRFLILSEDYRHAQSEVYNLNLRDSEYTIITSPDVLMAYSRYHYLPVFSPGRELPEELYEIAQSRGTCVHRDDVIRAIRRERAIQGVEAGITQLSSRVNQAHFVDGARRFREAAVKAIKEHDTVEWALAGEYAGLDAVELLQRINLDELVAEWLYPRATG